MAFAKGVQKKVCIQHKAVEDGDILARSLLEGEEGVGGGVPYLYGPTWPVPDTYETLVDALVRNGTGFNVVSTGEYSEGLKEEKHMLEVH